MRRLNDKSTGLTWLIPEVTEILHDNPVYTAEDMVLLEDFRKELNDCNSENISKFVTGNCDGLGNFILWTIMGKKSPCYGFEDGRLVATAVISPNNQFGKMKELKDYIKYCEENPSIYSNGIQGYISYKKAKMAVERATASNNTDIDYLVVIPKAQGRGIGTRAVSSITHNLDFFAPEKEIATVTSQIHKKNTASQIIFARNGFEHYSLETDLAYSPFEEHLKTL